MLIYPKWVQLPLSTRQAIATQFGVAKVRSIHVSDNQVVDDGFNIEALDAALTDAKIEEFLGVESTDSLVLWDLLIARFENPVVEVVDSPANIETPVEPVIETSVEAPKEEIKEEIKEETPVVEEKKEEVVETPVPAKRGRPAKTT